MSSTFAIQSIHALFIASKLNFKNQSQKPFFDAPRKNANDIRFKSNTQTFWTFTPSTVNAGCRLCQCHIHSSFYRFISIIFKEKYIHLPPVFTLNLNPTFPVNTTLCSCCLLSSKMLGRSLLQPPPPSRSNAPR